MRRLCIAVLIILGVVSIIGCAQRKIAHTPEQPSVAQTQPETKTKIEEKQKTTIPDAITARDIPKESITERQIVKAQPSDIQHWVKELQTKIQDIYFDYDKHDIRDDAKPAMKEVSAMLSRNKNIRVIIEGHCDDRGTNEYNLGLGDRRANAAKEYLLSLGIPSAKIDTISYGEEKPVCAEQIEECWAKNRRAHFVLVEEGR